jgi:UDP-glucose 4-epimerase
MKVLVTGGAGFIGSHLVGRLLAKGDDVLVYDDLSVGSVDRIRQHFSNPRFRFLKGDLLDAPHTLEASKDADMVFHLASNADISKSMVKTDLDLRLGVMTLYNVLESMRLSGCRKIFFPSGSGVYGDVGTTLTNEDFAPLRPVSMYGASKLACEAIISAFCHMFDMQAWIGRLANIVGSQQTHGVVLDFVKKLRVAPARLEILGDGRQSKPYLHVTECVDAILTIVERANERVNVFNVAPDDTIDVRRIAQIVVEEMHLNDVRFEYTGGDRGWKGDVPTVRMDVAKLKRIGWASKLRSADAVRLAARELANEHQ